MKLTISSIARAGIDSLPYYGTFSRLNVAWSATPEEVEQAARKKIKSGHETPDALLFYAITKRWREHRKAGRII